MKTPPPGKRVFNRFDKRYFPGTIGTTLLKVGILLDEFVGRGFTYPIVGYSRSGVTFTYILRYS
jgi:hypothetical protein